MYIPYNSRYEFHKNKFGAVREDEEVIFRIILPRNFSAKDVYLVINKEDEKQEFITLHWDCMQGSDEEWWKGIYKPVSAGLYWYHFEYDTPFGRSKITCGDCSAGMISPDGRRWQLTVFKKEFHTPDFLKGGVIYQIFPDRFYNSGTKKENIPLDRILRNDYENEPYWESDGNGIIRNNDFFCGDLKGIEEKLDYIAKLGVTCIYLNPIFKAQSNHRYDTGDYRCIDPLLGTEEDFVSLCQKAKEKGIAVILDGVFSHTGVDSRYFNLYGNYDSIGAYQSQDSEYYSWYKFRNWPDDYFCWWNVKILPEVDETNAHYLDFITGKNGVARKWIRCGASGWRLDVADELPDIFLDRLYESIKEENEEAIVLGEVWEDASNKSSYGARRRYLQGSQLDSVMNYPFASAIIKFVRNGNTQTFMDEIMTILENYPKTVVDVLMNHISSHDTARIMNVLAGDDYNGRDRQWQAGRLLTKEQYEIGIKLVMLAASIQYTLPGVPSLYYGDEIGMQGYKDPFNRKYFDWKSAEDRLLQKYKQLGEMRKNHACFKDGRFNPVSCERGCVAFQRIGENESVMTIANRNEQEIDYYLDEAWCQASVITGGKLLENFIRIPPMTAAIIKIDKT